MSVSNPAPFAITAASTAIVFIDRSLPDVEQLAAAVKPGTDIVLLDTAQDGLLQIAQALAGRGGIEAIHVLSHGSAGALALGSAEITLDSLAGYGDALGTIRTALADGADLLLYGCDVAQGAQGQAFIAALAAATGASAASADLTGSVLLGGDWELEATVGQVQAASLGDDGALAAYAGVMGPLPMPSTSALFTFDAGYGPGKGKLTGLTDEDYLQNGDYDIDSAAVRLNIDSTNDVVLDSGSSGTGGLPTGGLGLTLGSTSQETSVRFSLSPKGQDPATGIDEYTFDLSSLQFYRTVANGPEPRNDSSANVNSTPDPLMTQTLRITASSGAYQDFDVVADSTGVDDFLITTADLANDPGFLGISWFTITSVSDYDPGNGLPHDFNVQVDNIALDNIKVQLADNTAPTVSAIEWVTPGYGITNADALEYQITFSEEVQGVGAGSFTVSGSTAEVTGVSTLDNIVYTVTVSGGDLASYDGVVTLDFAAGQNIADKAGIALDLASAPVVSQVTYHVDHSAPTVTSIVRTGAATSNGDSLGWIVTFSEAIDFVDPSAFTVSGTTAQVNQVLDLGNGAYEVMVFNGLYEVNGPVTLAFDSNHNLTDVFGNALVDVVPTSPLNETTYTLDHTMPGFVSASVDGDQLVLTYDEALDPASVPSWESFNVSVGGGVSASVMQVVVDGAGKTVTLTLGAPVLPGQSVSVAYLDPNNGGSGDPIQDAVGNDAMSVPWINVSNLTAAANHAPTVHDYISTSVSTGVASALPDYRVADVDGDNLTVTLHASNGYLGGLIDADSVTPGIQLIGSAASINAQLADATFTAMDNGTASVTISVSDGMGGAPVTATSTLAASSPQPYVSGGSIMGIPMSMPNSPSLVTGADGMMYMSVFDSGTQTARILKWDGSGWYVEASLSAAGLGYTALAAGIPIGVDQYGKIYALASSGDRAADAMVTLAVYDGTQWSYQEIEHLEASYAPGSSIRLSGASIVVTSDNVVNVAYQRWADPAYDPSQYRNVFITNASGDFTVSQSSVGDPDVKTLQQFSGLNGHSYVVQAQHSNEQLIINEYVNGSYVGSDTVPFDGVLVGAVTDANGAIKIVTAGSGELVLWENSGNGWSSSPVIANPMHGYIYTSYSNVDDYLSTGRTGLVKGSDGKIYLAIYEDDGYSNYTSKLLKLEDGAWVDGRTDLANFNALVGLTFAVDASGNVMIVNTDEAGNELPYIFGHESDFERLTEGPPLPAFVSATVDGTSLALHYDIALDGAHLPQADAFTVKVDNVEVNVLDVNIDGTIVMLSLATPALSGQLVTVAYTDPATGNDVNAIQGVDGTDAASLADEAVVNNSMPPSITSATYDAATHVLTVTGSGLATGGAIDVSKLSLTGEGGQVKSLSTIDGVTAASSTGFSFALNAADASIVNQMINKNGATSTSGTSFNLAAQANWISGAAADATNAVTASNVAIPTITSVVYDVTRGVASVTGTGFLKFAGNLNDIDLSKFTFSGEEGLSRTLNTTAGFEITSDTSFTIDFGSSNINAISRFINKAGTTSTGGYTYNLALADDWNRGADPALSIADLTGNVITAINVPTPTISGVTYNAATGVLLFSGSGFVRYAGVDNDIDVSKLSIVGDGVSYTLTTADVEAGTHNSFAITLNAADRLALGSILNKNGATSNGGFTYNLAAADGWIRGADPALHHVDAVNAITVSNIVADTTAPILQSASVTGTTLVLTYNEALDAARGPDKANFTVTVGGQAVTVNGAMVDPVAKTVTLTLAHAVQPGQSVMVSYADSSNGVNAIQDASGNDAVSLVNQVVTNNSFDTLAPTLTSAVVNGTSLVLSYDEALDLTQYPGNNAFQVKIGGTVVGVTSVAVNGNAGTVTLTLAAAAQPDDQVTLSYQAPSTGGVIQDAAGNDAATVIDLAVDNTSPDTLAPTLQSADVNGKTLVLTYNEVLDISQQLGAGAFTVKVGGDTVTVTGAVVNDDKTVTLTLDKAVQPNELVTVSYQAPSTGGVIQDAAGNDAATVTELPVDNTSLDTLAPTLQSASVIGTTLVLTYDEALDISQQLGASAFDVKVGGETVTVTGAVVNGDKTVTLTLDKAVQPEQTVTVSYQALSTGGVIQDAAGNDAATVTDLAVDNTSFDTLAPTLQSASVIGTTLVLTYDEALDISQQLGAGTFAVKVGGETVSVTSAVVNNDKTVTVTLDKAVQPDEIVTVSYQASSTGGVIQDAAGNDAATVTDLAADNTSLDTLVPTLQSASVIGTTLVLTYDEALDNSQQLDAGAFSVKVVGETVTVTGAVVNDDKTVTLTLDKAVQPDQSVTLSYQAASTGGVIQDAAGNDAATVIDLAVDNTSPDTLAPTLQSASVNGKTLVLAYNETLDISQQLSVGGFNVKVGGETVTVTGAVVNDDKTVTLTLDKAVQPDQTVTLSYQATSTGGVIQDAAGNDAATVTDLAVDNTSLDTLVPTLQSASVIGTTLVLTYDEALDISQQLGAGAFTVKVGGETVTVTTAVVNNDKTVTLTLDRAVQPNEIVMVSYQASSTGGVIQDAAGNDAATVIELTVDNTSLDTLAPTLQSASVIGTTLVLTYNEALDISQQLGAGTFAVKVGGETVSVTSAVVNNDKTVTVTLDKALQPDEIVTVSYQASSTGGVIQDAAGNDAVTVIELTVDNASLDTLEPTLQSASVNGKTLVLTYDEALDISQQLGASAFDVKVGGETVTVTGAVVNDDKTVTLTLDKAVQPDQSVTLSYPAASTGGVIQDAAGNDAATVTDLAVDNMSLDTLAPSLQSASVIGTTLVLTYNEALDISQQLGAGAFGVKVGGETVSVTSAVVNNDKTVTLTLDKAVQPDQTVTVSYQAPSIGGVIQDATGNDAATVTDLAVDNTSLDTLAPTLQSADVNGKTLVLTYNEALDISQQLGTGAFAVKVGGETVSVTSAVVNNDKTVTITLDKAVQPNEIVTVSYQASSTGGVIQDAAGNDAATVLELTVDNTSLDTLAPTLQSASVIGTTLVLTYNEALDVSQQLGAGPFAVKVGGETVSVTSAVVNNDKTVTITLDKAAQPNEIVTVSYQASSTGGVIQDAAGNDAATVLELTVDNTSLDTLAPTLQSASVIGTTLVLTYNEALDVSQQLGAGGFTVKVGGETVTVTGAVVNNNKTVTLTLDKAVQPDQTVTVSYPAASTGGVIQDATGNDAATVTDLAVDNMSLDTLAPTLQSADVNGKTLVLTYNEALDISQQLGAGGFTVKVSGETVTVTTVVVNNDKTVTLTLDKAVQPNEIVTVSYQALSTGGVIQDAAGNEAAPVIELTVDNTSLDTLAPTLQSASVIGTTLVLTYNEALDVSQQLGAGGFTVKVGGETVSVTSAVVNNDKTVTLTLDKAVQPDQTVTVSYQAPSIGGVIQDATGNDAATVTELAVDNTSLDTLAPALQSAGVNGKTLVLTYNEALDISQQLGAGGFTVKVGGETVTVTGAVVNNDKTVTLTLDKAVQPNDIVTVSYQALLTGGVIQDATGNDAAAVIDLAVDNTSLDTLAPTLQSAGVNGKTLVLTYNEALDISQQLGAGGFTVKVGGETVTVTTVVVNNDKTVTLTLDKAVQPNEIVTVSHQALSTGGVIQDAAGNDAATVIELTVDNTSLDTLAPTLQSASVIGTTLVLTYNEALDVSQQLGAGGFTVKVGGETVSVTSAVVNNDKTVTLTLDKAMQPDQTVTVSYQAPSIGGVIQDATGNDAATVTELAVDNTSLDTLAPALQSAGVNGKTLMLTYNEALDISQQLGAGGFTVKVGGETVTVTGAVVNNDKTVTLTLDKAVQPNDIVTVSYQALSTGGVIQDATGNDAATVTELTVDNTSLDTLAPALQSADVNGKTLVLTYNEALDISQQIGAGAFAVKVGGETVSVTSAVVNNDKTVTLTLDQAAQPDQSVTVSYQAPSIGGLIQDASGNDATSVVDHMVTNHSGDTLAPTLLSAAVNGTSLMLVYIETLDAIHRPKAGDFAVKVDGQTVTVNSVSIDPLSNVVRLVLASAVQPDQVVTVSYNDPTGADDSHAIQDAAGNDTAGLVDQEVANNSLDTLAPAFVSAAVNGRTLVMTYNETLDATHGPSASAFSVDVGGRQVAVTTVAIDATAKTVTLTLASNIQQGQSVTVSYTDPTEGNDDHALQDAAGNDAASVANQQVANNTPAAGGGTPPVTPPASGTVDGVTVVTEQVRNADGSTSTRITIPVVTASRDEQVGNNDVADIPLASNAAGGVILQAQLPVGFGMTSSGSGIKTAGDALSHLIREIKAHTAAGSADQDQLTGGGSGFLGDLASSTNLLVQTIVPTFGGTAAPSGPLAITGLPFGPGNPLTAIVLDGSGLPAGTQLTLDNVDFAAIIGAVNVSGGAGAQKVWGDGASQTIFLGEGDDVLHGGGGNDIVGSAGGNDRVYGDEGDDIVFGGEGDDYVDGGSGHDIALYSGAGRDGYSLRMKDGQLVIRDLHGSDGTDTVVDVEVLRFTGAPADTTVRGTVARLIEAASGAMASDAAIDTWLAALEKGTGHAAVAHSLLAANGLDKLGNAGFVDALYHNVLGRDTDAAGKAYWVAALDAGKIDKAGAALLIADSAEKIALGQSVDLDFNQSDVATLVRMYETLFARHADEDGLNFWIGLHESGTSMTQLADYFVASGEASAKYGALTDAQFVDALYLSAFDRVGSAGEQAFWLGGLASGQLDRGDLLLGFADSLEMLTLVGAIDTSITTI